MKIENQQELEKLIKLLRKTGVESLKMGELELRLSPDEPQSKYKQKQRSQILPELNLTAEEKMIEEEKHLFWSSTPPGMSEA